MNSILKDMDKNLVEGEHQTEKVDQDPEGVEDVMTIGTLQEQNQVS